MKTIMTAAALSAMVLSGSAMAQKMVGPKAGTTRDAAIATAAATFATMDANKDGSIDNAEALTALQKRAKKGGKAAPKPAAAGKMISRNDGNGDGKVTLDEFKATAGAAFDKADTNKNGTIDPNETGGAE